jgi:hypothetical protein
LTPALENALMRAISTASRDGSTLGRPLPRVRTSRTTPSRAAARARRVIGVARGGVAWPLFLSGLDTVASVERLPFSSVPIALSPLASRLDDDRLPSAGAASIPFHPLPHWPQVVAAGRCARRLRRQQDTVATNESPLPAFVPV